MGREVKLDRPLISVLMGVYYKRENIEMLCRAVQSILNQSITDFEFLICDDGSSKEAMEYLDEISAADSRIKLIRHGELFSLPQKLNACLAAAKGKYIARMDDDDYSHPNRFVQQIDYLEKHSDIAFCGCSVNLCRNGAVIGKRILPHFPTVEDFYFVQPFIHPALMFRREALIAVNGYSEDKYCILCEDYDLLLRLYAVGYKGANIQQELFDYTLPLSAKGSRKMKHRFNEAVTRYRRFGDLKRLPKALPYVIKPLAVGLIPEPVLKKIKERR